MILTTKKNRLPNRLKSRTRLRLELLEVRDVPSGASWIGLLNPVAEQAPHATLHAAQDLGTVPLGGQLAVVGDIGKTSGNASEVDWYSFTLALPAQVTLSTVDRVNGSSFVSVLSLYNNDQGDFSDTYNPLGYRLLAQADGAALGGDALIQRTLSAGIDFGNGLNLAAGTYFVAVSGSGNRFFHPLIPDSGLPGSTGAYGLKITAVDPGFGTNPGPFAIFADLGVPAVQFVSNGPPADTAINQSPFVIRIGFSSPLDPASINIGQNVQLIQSADGFFDDSTSPSFTISGYFDPAVNELKITPSAPIGPGFYRVVLSGDPSGPVPVLTDLSGAPLGSSGTNGAGSDYNFTFQVLGAEGTAGSTGGDNTPASAQQLHDITHSGLVQVQGAIGVNPADPAGFNPADLNLYHFQISGLGRFSLQAEVFAGRIGSPLDSGLSLFRLDPNDHQLHLVIANDDTQNGTQTDDHFGTPLFTDSSLFAGLRAGDYYVAVTSGGDLSSPPLGWLVDQHGIFQPDYSRSSVGNPTTGQYVLNLVVQSDNSAPKLLSVTLRDGTALRDGAVLTIPPTGFRLNFSEPVNLAQLAALNTNQGGVDSLPQVFWVGADRFDPPWYSGTDATERSFDFLIYDGLPNGNYELHLSGALGIEDLAGNALQGNSPGGDCVIHFQIAGSARSAQPSPTTWVIHGGIANIGPLFPNELEQPGVTLQRNAGQGNGHDSYQIELLQTKDYTFSLTSGYLPAGATLTIRGSDGLPVRTSKVHAPNQLLEIAHLAPGHYTIQVDQWSVPDGYLIEVTIPLAMESPPPLTIGAGPALRITINNIAGPPNLGGGPSTPPVLPPTGGGTGILPVSFPPPSGQVTIPSVPSSVLASLGTGPITTGGTTTLLASQSTGDVYDRILAFAPESVLPGIAVRLPILIQYQSSGANQPEATVGAVSSLVGDIVTRVGNVSWKRAVELLHWIEELNAVDTIAIPDAEDNGPSGTKAVPAPLQPGRQDDEEAPQAMGASMFLLGTGLLLNTAKQRRRERIRFSSLLEA